MNEQGGESKEEVIYAGILVRNRETGTRMRLTKRHRELIPETWRSITKGAISYFLARMMVDEQD